jgi:TRAP-type transport system periplasmic protein
MKKGIAILFLVALISSLVLAMVGCGGSTPAPTSSAPAQTSAAPATTTAPKTTAPASSAPASAAPATSAAPAGKVIELTLNLPIGPGATRYIGAIKPWTDELEKRAQGKVKVTPYFAEAVSPISQNYNSIVSGLADIGEATMDASPGRFPLLEQIFYLSTPSVFVKNKSKIINELVKSFPALANETKETKMITLHGAAHNNITTINKPVDSLKALSGLKINVVGFGLASNKMKAIGASVVSIPLADVYSSLEKGVMDGSIASTEILISRKWGDLLKTLTPVNLNTGVFYFAMNKSKYDSLPADIKKIIDDMSGDYASDLFNKFWNDGEKTYYDQWVKAGGKTYHFSAEDVAKIDSLTKPVIEQFVNDQAAKGLPYKDIYQKYLDLEKQESGPWPY